MKLEGSVALVTGANRGLGKALVAALVEAGAAKVYAAARDTKKLSADAPRVVPLAFDTTKPEQIDAAVKNAGDVTLLVNNAGALTSYNVLASSQADFDADFRTNVHGTLAVIKAFLPVLERAPGGATVVNVLSLTSLALRGPSSGSGLRTSACPHGHRALTRRVTTEPRSGRRRGSAPAQERSSGPASAASSGTMVRMAPEIDAVNATARLPLRSAICR